MGTKIIDGDVYVSNDDYTELHFMNDEDKVAIFRAWIDNPLAVEYYFEFLDIWKRSPSELKPAGIYRASPFGSNHHN